MVKTASQTVHDIVNSSKTSLRPLDVYESARRIALMHDIPCDGIWLIEQALLMVGSRASIGMKIGRETVTSSSVDDGRPPVKKPTLPAPS